MMTDDVTCPRCGALSAAGSRLCMGCGGSLPEGTGFDAPTRAHPAVSTERGETEGERPTETFAVGPIEQPAAQPPSAHTPLPAPAVSARLPPRRRRQVLKASYAAAGAAIALLVIAALFVAGQLGELLGRQPVAEPGATPASGAAVTDPPPSPANGAAPDCEAKSVTAPNAGAWRMATRRGDIVLSSQGSATRLLLRIYRAGSTNDAASVAVEALSAVDVESRYGATPPGGAEAALAVTFSPEFRMSGRSFELGRVGTVEGVLISSTDDGIVGLVGLRGAGCFSLRAPGWEDGPEDRSAEIIIDVER
jgi:hypothetical protein